MERRTITESVLKQTLSQLVNELNEDNKKKVIAKAFSLGMQYRESQIKDGLDIVFETLHKK